MFGSKINSFQHASNKYGRKNIQRKINLSLFPPFSTTTTFLPNVSNIPNTANCTYKGALRTKTSRASQVDFSFYTRGNPNFKWMEDCGFSAFQQKTKYKWFSEKRYIVSKFVGTSSFWDRSCILSIQVIGRIYIYNMVFKRAKSPYIFVMHLFWEANMTHTSSLEGERHIHVSRRGFGRSTLFRSAKTSAWLCSPPCTKMVFTPSVLITVVQQPFSATYALTANATPWHMEFFPSTRKGTWKEETPRIQLAPNSFSNIVFCPISPNKSRIQKKTLLCHFRRIVVFGPRAPHAFYQSTAPAATH